jgi:hypothetical protein
MIGYKGAVKLHTLIDLRGNIPCFIRIIHGKTTDATMLDHLPIEPGTFYMMDKGYIDFGRLYAFARQMAFFVILPDSTTHGSLLNRQLGHQIDHF